MPDVVQVKAVIPRALKRRAFGALALREQRFSHWLQTQLEEWLRQIEQNREGMAGNDQGIDEEATLQGRMQINSGASRYLPIRSIHSPYSAFQADDKD